MKTLLLGEILTFDELDKIMVENGYYSEDDDCLSNNEVLENIIKDGTIVYTLRNDDLEHAVVSFDLMVRANDEYLLSSSEIKITDVDY